MATILTTNTPKAMWPGILEWWGTSYNDWDKQYINLYEIVTSTKNYEEDVQVIGLGLAPELSENDPVAYDTVMQGYTTRYTPKKYGIAFSISKEAMDDNLYMDQVLNSDLQSNTAENAINVVKGTFPRGYFINNEFTDTDAWYIRTDVSPGMKGVHRQEPEFEDAGDFETGARKYKATMRSVYGCSDWRGIFGSQGA